MQPSQVKLLIQGKQEGKCLTSQNLRDVKYKLKSSDRNGRCESELLVNTVKELLSNDALSKVKLFFLMKIMMFKLSVSRLVICNNYM